MSIPARLRRFVTKRAGERCEYCLLPEEYAFQKYEPDHVVASQHDGRTDASNLALACFLCNRNKGPNDGSFDPTTGRLTRFSTLEPTSGRITSNGTVRSSNP